MAREVTARVIAFDRSRGRGIVDLEGRAIVVDASIVDASFLLVDDAVSVAIGDDGRVTAVRVLQAAAPIHEGKTAALFSELLDAQHAVPRALIEALVARDDVHEHVRSWIERWDRPIRFWEPNNVAALLDTRRSDAQLTAVLEHALELPHYDDRLTWTLARLRARAS